MNENINALKIAAFFCMFFFIAIPAFSANGDVIWSGCGATCDASFAGSKTGWTRTIETTGCSSGECLKLDAAPNGQGNCGTGETRYGAGNTSISTSSVSGYDEITVVYKVKFDSSNRAINDGNIKGVRPLQGSSGSYTFATLDAHFGRDFYMASWENGATLSPESVVTFVNTNAPYCTQLMGDYDCNKRMQISFTVDSMDGYPANTWREVRHWFKLPTSGTSADGEAKMWVDDTLVFHLTDVDQDDEDNTVFSSLLFYPSSEDCDDDVEHWLDEMKIYEGYVPPGSSYSHKRTPSAPTNLQIVN
jgi:hypothetical protein